VGYGACRPWRLRDRVRDECIEWNREPVDFKVSASGLKLLSAITIASGYVHRGDPVALFVAPTGLVYDGNRDRLYVRRRR